MGVREERRRRRRIQPVVIGRGTLVNALAVLVGGSLGLALGRRLPQRIQETVLQALGAVTAMLGVHMTLAVADRPAGYAVAVLISLVAGAVVGEVMDLHGRFERLAAALERRAGQGGEGRLAQGFLAASLLFCVGPMTVLGSIQDGLGQTPVLLYAKSALDGVAAVGLAAGLGAGTLLSAVTVVAYQGGITLAAALSRAALGEVPLTVMTAAGGVMVLTIGLNILGLTRVRTMNLVPGLAVAALAEALLRAAA